MRQWKVAGGLITNDDGLLLVANRRRDGRIDWSTPGGVVDAGETLLGALSREVEEETGLAVATWSQLCWTTEVHFVDLEMHLEVEVHLAEAYLGDIVVDDPDGIVIEADFLDAATVHDRLGASPPWVAEPMRRWIAEPWRESRHFAYRALGRVPAEMSAERIQP
ncbi:MAG: NUDIX hydrolase [Acidimicrobiales bacterium]